LKKHQIAAPMAKPIESFRARSIPKISETTLPPSSGRTGSRLATDHHRFWNARNCAPNQTSSGTTSWRCSIDDVKIASTAARIGSHSRISPVSDPAMLTRMLRARGRVARRWLIVTPPKPCSTIADR
jgi:hypothetical protein